MQSNTPHKEYKDVDIELILRSGNSFLPAQTIKCSLFCIYSKPFSPYPGIIQCEAMARIDQRDILALEKNGYVMLEPQTQRRASFIHEGITWDVYDYTMHQENKNSQSINFLDFHLNKNTNP